MKPIWIVDDDHSIRFVLEKALTREQFMVRAFSNARDVLAALDEEAPQVLVSDIRMPGGTGIELLSKVKLRHPESHWSAAGGIAGEPVRLVPTLTHGAALQVPADAEIVIEGRVPPQRFVADGPFAEYTGYVGVQTATPMVEVTCITRRVDAIYTDFGAGLEDHLVPENMAMEGRLYALVKPVAPTLVNVHVPYSGRRRS